MQCYCLIMETWSGFFYFRFALIPPSTSVSMPLVTCHCDPNFLKADLSASHSQSFQNSQKTKIKTLLNFEEPLFMGQELLLKRISFEIDHSFFGRIIAVNRVNNSIFAKKTHKFQ